MTDTATAPAASTSGNVTLDVDTLSRFAKEIAGLDEQISAAGGSEAAIRKSVSTRILAENSTVVSQVTDTLVAEMHKLPSAVIVGLLERLPEAMAEEFEAQISEVVDAQVEELTKSVKGNVEPLKELRRTKVEMFKATKAILEGFGMDVSSVPDPKRAGGRTAGSTSSDGPTKTGKNNENYRYSMNGKDRPKSQNTFSSLAYYSTVGCAGTEAAPERWSTKQLKDFLVENGIKWGKPGDGQDEWSINLPNNTVIAARRLNAEKDADIFAAVAKAEKEDKENEDSGEEETPTGGADTVPETDPALLIQDPQV